MRSTFASVVTGVRSASRSRLPSSEGQTRATTFEALEGLAKQNFFSASSTKSESVIVLTDGESRSFDPRPLVGGARYAEAIELYLVRFWHEDERVWQESGSSPSRYRPDPSSEAMLASLATGPRISTFGEAEIGGVRAAVERFFGEGPLVEAAVDRRATPLAPWLALASAVPLAFLLVRRPR